MSIGGDPVGPESTFGVINPSTGEVFAQAPECSKDQLDAAFTSAQSAFSSWRSDEDQRRKTLLAMADVLLASIDTLAPLLTTEQGKPLNDAGVEVFAAAIWCQYFANLETPPQVIQDDADALVHVVRRPLGVVAAITPWNFPLTLAFWKIAPAPVSYTHLSRPSACSWTRGCCRRWRRQRLIDVYKRQTMLIALPVLPLEASTMVSPG